MATLGRGRSTDGATWELDVSLGDRGLSTMVNLRLADGRTPWGGGCSGPPTRPGKRISVYTGSCEDGPTTFLARVTGDVCAVVVTLSDGTREDLVLYGEAEVLGARIAVLVYPGDLDVHRVDLFGSGGGQLAEETG